MLIFALVLLTVCRVLLGAWLELSPREAYGWEWSRRWSFAGVEGGGGAAWLAWVGTAVAGDTALGVRLFAPFVAALGTFFVFRITQALGGERAAPWAVVLLNVTPGFNLGAVFLSSAWMASSLALGGVWFFWKALHHSGRAQWRWIATGVCWAVALWWDGCMAWLPPMMLVVCAAARPWRSRLVRPGVWLALFCFLVLGFGPLVWWDAQHGEAWTLGWQRRLHWNALDFGLQLLGEMAGTATLAASPLLLLGFGWACWRAIRLGSRAPAATFMCWLVLPGVVLLGLAALFGFGNEDLLTPALPLLVILLALTWQPARHSGLRQALQFTALSVAVLLSFLALDSDLLRQCGVALPYRPDRSRAWRGWQETAAESAQIIQEAAKQADGNAVFLIAEDAPLASVLDFYLPRDLPVFRPSQDWPRVQVVESAAPTSQFAFWGRYDAASPTQPPILLGKTALYFTDATNRDGPPENIVRAFAETEPLMIFEPRRHGFPLRRLKVFACYDYRGLEL